MQTFRISADQAGQRLDKYVRKILKGVPLSVVYRAIRTKTVRVNGARAENAQLLKEGDEVLFRVDPEKLIGEKPPESEVPKPPPVLGGIEVLYEDDHVLAINKPSGMAVHTGSGIRDGTVVDEVRAYLGPRAIRNEFAASPAHRIDRETSGVLLVAKTRRAMVRFTEIFTAGTAKKLYLTLAKGRVAREKGTIDIALQEHQQTPRSKQEHGVRMQPAVTHFTRLAHSPVASLLACTIETGRTHQIRRHLAAIGHPVVGDGKHGDFAFNREARGKYGLDRMFLHALKIELEHPIHAGRLKVAAPLPPELRSALKRLNLQLPPEYEVKPKTPAPTGGA
jgi:23S rRNA pseudouridine955/2504/2580 synthase